MTIEPQIQYALAIYDRARSLFPSCRINVDDGEDLIMRASRAEFEESLRGVDGIVQLHVDATIFAFIIEQGNSPEEALNNYTVTEISTSILPLERS